MILRKINGYKKRKRKKKISKNTAYKRGRSFEYRVMKHFQRLGYYVRRNYASKGAEDLNAMKKVGDHSELLHIQCKNLAVEKPLSSREKDNLRALAKITGGKILHVFNRNHKLVVEEIV